MSDAIREAARALLTALDASDEASIGIFAVASIHGAKYAGPTHGVQKEALRTALLAPHPAATVESKAPAKDGEVERARREFVDVVRDAMASAYLSVTGIPAHPTLTATSLDAIDAANQRLLAAERAAKEPK